MTAENMPRPASEHEMLMTWSYPALVTAHAILDAREEAERKAEAQRQRESGK